MIGRWLRQQRSLQQRVAILAALAVAAAVLITGGSAWLTARISLYDQLDQELQSLAVLTSQSISQDLSTMGGLNADALRTANVTIVVVRADGQQLHVPGVRQLDVGPAEVAVARLGSGSSSRTGQTGDGEEFRIVAVPMEVANSPERYALVIGRSLAPTSGLLRAMTVIVLIGGTVGVGVAAAAGAWIARSSLLPVRRLSEAVGRITRTDELEPIAVEGDDELGRLTRSFNTMLRSLSSSRDRQQRLIADASHELRTPLTSLRTNVELLVADERTGMLPPGARREILQDIAAQQVEFTTLVNDLVQLARDDKVHTEPEPVDMTRVISHALERARRRGPHITFEVNLEPLHLMGDPESLERAMTNLLDNAVKFSPADGTIRVWMEGTSIHIADEGPGISEADASKVFDRFYRSDLSRNTPGSGLGLSIVKQAINSHGGSVSVHRAHHRDGSEAGAEFVVTLPGTRRRNDLYDD
ncbi:HAMP domain-containing sensor histidine kinase [Parenemella sanctibonifatiensis]|uniref:histidine kinase n=1 Tax=Parenemella sanctibonifatiensis TaxID=2016505 RepID=A0A255E7M1_9ACTN|nr:HAMP domain-containing sensor histidine kinase [Parenemella sanctibonifatiensis]OYN84113.1 two-component sensor histidine kinase [Parenemella sanctibonifatiensis]